MSKPALPRDPWRTGKPDDAPGPNEKVIGTATSDHPLDWDLKPERKFVMRPSGQPYALRIRDAETPDEAAVVLLKAMKHPVVRAALTEAGFRIGPRQGQAVIGFVIATEDELLWNTTAATVAHGFYHLTRTLLGLSRSNPDVHQHLQQTGVVPLLS